MFENEQNRNPTSAGDSVGHSPTTTDDVRPSPTMSDIGGSNVLGREDTETRHTMTTKEVARVFEQQGVARDTRSIERYCEQEKLDCWKDPDEGRWFIASTSAEILIEKLKEIRDRHTGAQGETEKPLVSSDDTGRQGQTSSEKEQPVSDNDAAKTIHKADLLWRDELIKKFDEYRKEDHAVP